MLYFYFILLSISILSVSQTQVACAHDRCYQTYADILVQHMRRLFINDCSQLFYQTWVQQGMHHRQVSRQYHSACVVFF